MKNPFMSMWLSSMNSAAGQMRGFWTAEIQRQQKAYMREMSRAFGLSEAHEPSARTKDSKPRRRSGKS